MKTHSRYAAARKILLFWCWFVGIGAIAGAIGMLVAPDGSALGMQAILPSFQVLPFADVLFQNFIFPGIALLIVNGLTNLTAAVLLMMKKHIGIVLGMIFGITLMLWICIQFVIFPFNFMSTAYFIFGLAQAATGYAALVFDKQERFSVDEKDYPSIGTNPKELIVYFSRMGYGKKLAMEAANQSGAELYEVTTSERTQGTLGFWWCGRYGMHGWKMPIDPVKCDLEKYDKVTICSPIWVFALSAPMKSFCEAASGKLKSADYILVHHMKCDFSGVAKSMDEALKIKHERLQSVCCRKGAYIRREMTGSALYKNA